MLLTRAIVNSSLQVKGVFFLAIFFAASIGVIVYYLYEYPDKIILRMAKEDARAQINALASFRTLYTSEVVTKAKNAGLNVTHTYQNNMNNIPLPATLTKMIGKEIASFQSGSEAYLYSAFPFPWRLEDGGLNDQFRKDAWQFFSQEENKNNHYYKIESINGQQVLRYATADLMREACIDCHNNHPDTPKSDWQLMDLRGIIEVKKSLDGAIATAGEEAQLIFWIVLSVGILGVTGLISLGVMAQKSRRTELKLKHANEKLQDQVTKRVQAERLAWSHQQKMEEATRLATLGEMAAGIGHEISNPLMVVFGNLERLESIMKQEALDWSKIKPILEVIKNMLGRVNKILGSMQASARCTESDPYEFTEVLGIIETISVLAEERVKRHGIDLRISAIPQNLTIECREAQICQVLINLLNNACDAIVELEDRWIHLNVMDLGNLVEFSVTDSGTGIAEEIQQQIFQPFFSTKEIGQGTGLGVSISKSIIENHHGYFYLNSKCPNTCFVIGIPKKKVASEEDSKVP